MSSDLVSPAINLGVAGFALLIMWWMYQSAAAERKAYDERLDKRDENYRALEREVRTEISAQLISATSAVRDNSKIMERVIQTLSK
jgi:hypothetical protein